MSDTLFRLDGKTAVVTGAGSSKGYFTSAAKCFLQL